MIEVEKRFVYQIDGEDSERLDNPFTYYLLCLTDLLNYNKKKIYNFCVDNYYNDVYGINFSIKEESMDFLNRIIGDRYKLSDDRNDIIDSIAAIDNQTGKSGFLNLNGEVVIPCIYDYVDEFIYGIARVEKDGRKYFIDKRNNIVHEPTTYSEWMEYEEYAMKYRNGCVDSDKYNERVTLLESLSSSEYIIKMGVVAINLYSNLYKLVIGYRPLFMIMRDGEYLASIEEEEKDILIRKLKNI